MSQGTIRKLGAALLLSVVGAGIVPGCILQIGTTGDSGEAGQGASDPGTTAGAGGVAGGGGQAGGAGGAELDQEIADANGVYAEHPEEVELANVRSRLTGLALSHLIDASVQDWNDVAEVEALADQYTGAAIEQANTWLGQLDPAALANVLSSTPQYPIECVYPLHDCDVKPFICPWLGDGHLCYLSDCGEGTCGLCPLPFPIPVRRWCAYQCFLVGDHTYVGSAIYLTLIGGKRLGPICIPK